MNARETLKINAQGHLEIGGCDAVALAEQYGTPLYVMDEAYIRKMAKVYTSTLLEEYGDGTVLYASKAFCCKEIYRIVKSMGLGADVVSRGELYTALSAGFPADKICFHGNNKSKEELKDALASRVGRIVADSFDEIDFLDAVCKEAGIVQSVLLRVNPGVEAHTHHYIQTARIDSKFGLPVSQGFAEQGVARILASKNLKLTGLSCHIGSQIFEAQAFSGAAVKMAAFMEDVKNKFGVQVGELDMGGGFGVWYAEGDAKLSAADYAKYVRAVTDPLKQEIAKRGLKKPHLMLEPGRSLVAEAGVTLYTAGTVKEIPGVRKFVAIDGGMFENPRYALYQAKYTAALANRMNESETEKVTLTGKCCESGDMIIDEAFLPPAKRGDIVAVFSTGAYNYSMASNYNRNLVPPVVKVMDGKSEYMVRPQSMEDLVRNDR